MAIEIVDLPIENGDFPSFFVYQRVSILSTAKKPWLNGAFAHFRGLQRSPCLFDQPTWGVWPAK